jgi:hypothetical protein
MMAKDLGVLPPFQIIIRLTVHSKINVKRKVKAIYNLEQRECIINIVFGINYKGIRVHLAGSG